MANKLAVDKRTALMMFWNAGYNTESRMLAAFDRLDSMEQPTPGYWYADDVSNEIDKGFDMFNAGDMFDALKFGRVNDATKYLRTYGTTVSRTDTDDKTGCKSVITIAYYTRQFVLEMHNGETLAISVDGERYTKK